MNCRKLAVAVIFAALFVGVGTCQTTDTASAPLTNEGILKLAKAGLSADVMMAMIENQPGEYKVDADSVVALKAGGVPEKVITAVITHTAHPAKSAAAAANGDGIYSVGNGTIPPSVISKVNPDYSEEAQAAKLSGSVILSLVVNTNGEAEDIKIVRGLGMGLDQKAIEAVRKWRFNPGINKGVPVKVRAQIEVNFRI
jgi:TonB family protein